MISSLRRVLFKTRRDGAKKLIFQE